MDDSRQRVALAASSLVQICRDCGSALGTAADVSESSEVRDRFRGRADIWQQFGRALAIAVQDAGGASPEHPGVTGILQRAWIKIKSASGEADAIAAECSKREAEALQRCAKAMNAGLPTPVRAIVERYYARLVATPPLQGTSRGHGAHRGGADHAER
jgi:uncharacterized protein (TIGR02284 family)